MLRFQLKLDSTFPQSLRETMDYWPLLLNACQVRVYPGRLHGFFRDLGILERGLLAIFIRSQALEQAMNHAHLEHGFATAGVVFAVLTVAPVATEPGKGPLHHPTPV